MGSAAEVSAVPQLHACKAEVLHIQAERDQGAAVRSQGPRFDVQPALLTSSFAPTAIAAFTHSAATLIP